MLSPRQKQTQELRVDQRIVLSARLLQANTLEIESIVEQELAENPAIERIESGAEETDFLPGSLHRRGVEFIYDGDGGDAPDAELDILTNLPDESLTLREYLSQELRAQLPTSHHCLIDYFLDNLDGHGLLRNFDIDRASLETGAPAEAIDEVLKVLQSLDPPGIGARSVGECMLLQLRYLREQGQGNELAERIVEKYFHRLASPPVRRIARELDTSTTEVQEALQYIREALHPYPAHRFRTPWGSVPSAYREALKPDIIIRRNPQGFEVEIVRPGGILIVSPQWREQYERVKKSPNDYPPETVQQVTEYVGRAEKFLSHLATRYHTLQRITRAVIDHQFPFLETGSHTFLKPLTRTQMAEQLGVHESTISRAISNKWVLLPNGDLIPFSDFFTPSLSVQQAIQQVIRSEDPYHPYHDDEIAEIVYKRWGIKASRRTVVKHRLRLHIPSSRERRRKK